MFFWCGFYIHLVYAGCKYYAICAVLEEFLHGLIICDACYKFNVERNYLMIVISNVVYDEEDIFINNEYTTKQ
jgi:hypothetical protein